MENFWYELLVGVVGSLLATLITSVLTRLRLLFFERSTAAREVGVSPPPIIDWLELGYSAVMIMGLAGSILLSLGMITRLLGFQSLRDWTASALLISWLIYLGLSCLLSWSGQELLSGYKARLAGETATLVRRRRKAFVGATITKLIWLMCCLGWSLLFVTSTSADIILWSYLGFLAIDVVSMIATLLAD
jgi:hypothetical protein